MDNHFFDQQFEDDGDRVTGRAVVTGAAKYAAEYNIAGLVYGVLVGSTVASGTISAIDSNFHPSAPRWGA